MFNDPNGLADSLVNGTALGNITGTAVYAYLVDMSDKVVTKVTLNSTLGTYTFPAVDMFTNYKVMLSTSSLTVGSIAPASGTMSSGWVKTGDYYGLNNLMGATIEPGNPDCSVPVNTGSININAVNFGVQRLPNSDNKSVNYTANTPGLKYNVPALSGTDPEDGILGTGKTYKITSQPANAVLFYNSMIVSLNQVIPSFNPALFKIDPADGIITTSFTYASMDAAGMFDPTPATVTFNWVVLLPVKLLDFTGKLNGTKVDLFWATSSESNSSHFEVEHSTDGQEFKAFTIVRAKGTSNSESNYAAIDPLPVKGLNYYRLKMVDKDGAYDYSKIVIIKLNAECGYFNYQGDA